MSDIILCHYLLCRVVRLRVVRVLSLFVVVSSFVCHIEPLGSDGNGVDSDSLCSCGIDPTAPGWPGGKLPSSTVADPRFPPRSPCSNDAGDITKLDPPGVLSAGHLALCGQC